MKALFFTMCVVCAISLSLLSVIMKTGRIPFHAAPPAPVAAAQPSSESLTVFSDSSKAVEELISALKAERAQYEKKLADLGSREEEVRLQESVVQRLQSELRELQAQLDDSIARIAEAEKTNLRRLAEVCGKMDPAGASTSLMQMEKERAAMILSLMNERQAAGILDATVAQGEKGAVLVAEWTDIMRRMARDEKPKARRGA